MEVQETDNKKVFKRCFEGILGTTYHAKQFRLTLHIGLSALVQPRFPFIMVWAYIGIVGIVHSSKRTQDFKSGSCKLYIVDEQK